MKRDDRRLVKRGIVAFCLSLGCLWLVGQLMLWSHPLSEIDKKCMKETMLKVGECMRNSNGRK